MTHPRYTGRPCVSVVYSKQKAFWLSGEPQKALHLGPVMYLQAFTVHYNDYFSGYIFPHFPPLCVVFGKKNTSHNVWYRGSNLGIFVIMKHHCIKASPGLMARECCGRGCLQGGRHCSPIIIPSRTVEGNGMITNAMM